MASGFVVVALAAVALCGSAALRPAHAGNVVTEWNAQFLTITQQTSGNLVSGPPEVAREIAQIGAAMSDAVNAATGGTIASFAYSGTAVNADAGIAAATAAYTALTNIFTSSVWSIPIGSLTTNPALAGVGNNTTLATNIVLPELRTLLSSALGMPLESAATLCATATSALCNGYNLGIAAATAVNNSPAFSPIRSGAVAAITDGLNANVPAGSGTTAGVYVPPANPARPEMFLTWGTTAATGMTDQQLAAVTAAIPAPPAVGSAVYAAALLQTQCQGSSVGQNALPANVQAACTAAGYVQETTEQANAALFWNDPGTTIQPPGHWLQIANTVMASQNSSLLQSAQLSALLGEAMNDAGIAAWATKYRDNLWRPATAIQDCGPDGTAAGSVTWSTSFTTCDTAWSSLIATPPHPDFIAGHPAFSGAAATVLADFFGTDTIGFSSVSNYYCNGGTTQFSSGSADPALNGLVVSCTLNGVVFLVSNPDNGGQADCAVIVDGVNTNGSTLICPITETFASFSDASQGPNGAELSRVSGGIHTPFAVEDALAAGNIIGQLVAANAGLAQTVPEPSSLALCGLGLLVLARLRRQRGEGAA
jgi:hypothetical protein